MHRAAQKYYSPYLLLQIFSGKVFLGVCLWMLTVMKQGTAAHCARLKNMNGKAFPFISVVSNNELSKWDTVDNKRLQQTCTTLCRKRPGSQTEITACQPICAFQATGCRNAAGCQGGCVWTGQPLPSPFSLQPHHCERRKGTAPFFTLCLLLCQKQERFYLCSILSLHLGMFLHSFGDGNLMILLFARETRLEW